MEKIMKDDSSDLVLSPLSLDRREFLVTSILAAGAFALAVQPIQAQTRIVTDANSLTVGEVKIPVADGQIPAYRAMPDKKNKKFPVVLVIHEIFGVHEWIQDVCRRFAKLGYMAVAPALYARQGEVSTIQTSGELNRQIFSKIPDTQSMSDLDATVAWAKNNSGNTNKLSITGFCWGGRITWLYAAHNPKVDAGAAWYGRVVPTANSPKNEAQPTTPIDYAKDLKVPVIGLYGGLDKGIPLDGVQKMQDELKKGKSKSEIAVFPNADHGFLADYRPSYNKEAAEDAWKKMLDWFKKNGAA
jgi:carboxymethylenebutenolidase